jgi:hypothetical protein
MLLVSLHFHWAHCLLKSHRTPLQFYAALPTPCHARSKRWQAIQHVNHHISFACDVSEVTGEFGKYTRCRCGLAVQIGDTLQGTSERFVVP